MIKRIYQSKSLVKHIHVNADISLMVENVLNKWNKDKCQCECKKLIKHEKTWCMRGRLWLES